MLSACLLAELVRLDDFLPGIAVLTALNPLPPNSQGQTTQRLTIGTMGSGKRGVGTNLTYFEFSNFQKLPNNCRSNTYVFCKAVLVEKVSTTSHFLRHMKAHHPLRVEEYEPA